MSSLLSVGGAQHHGLRDADVVQQAPRLALPDGWPGRQEGHAAAQRTDQRQGASFHSVSHSFIHCIHIYTYILYILSYTYILYTPFRSLTCSVSICLCVCSPWGRARRPWGTWGRRRRRCPRRPSGRCPRARAAGGAAARPQKSSLEKRSSNRQTYLHIY